MEYLRATVGTSVYSIMQAVVNAMVCTTVFEIVSCKCNDDRSSSTHSDMIPIRDRESRVMVIAAVRVIMIAVVVVAATTLVLAMAIF